MATVSESRRETVATSARRPMSERDAYIFIRVFTSALYKRP